MELVADLGGVQRAAASPFSNRGRQPPALPMAVRGRYATVCPPPFNQPPTFKIPGSVTYWNCKVWFYLRLNRANSYVKLFHFNDVEFTDMQMSADFYVRCIYLFYRHNYVGPLSFLEYIYIYYIYIYL